MKPPRTPALRPTFGIGIAIGAFILLGSYASGSEPALGLVLGGGTGLALGLTRRSGDGVSGDDEREEARR